MAENPGQAAPGRDSVGTRKATALADHIKFTQENTPRSVLGALAANKNNLPLTQSPKNVGKNAMTPKSAGRVRVERRMIENGTASRFTF